MKGREPARQIISIFTYMHIRRRRRGRGGGGGGKSDEYTYVYALASCRTRNGHKSSVKRDRGKRGGEETQGYTREE